MHFGKYIFTKMYIHVLEKQKQYQSTTENAYHDRHLSTKIDV